MANMVSNCWPEIITWIQTREAGKYRERGALGIFGK